MDELLAMYREGAITAAQVVSEGLQMIDPENPGLVLYAMSDELRGRVLDYARSYRSGRMLSNYGTLPTLDQVEAAQRWVEAQETNHKACNLKQADDERLHTTKSS